MCVFHLSGSYRKQSGFAKEKGPQHAEHRLNLYEQTRSWFQKLFTMLLKILMQHWHLDNPEDGFVKDNKHINTALTFANRAIIQVQTTLWCHHAQGGGTTTSYYVSEAQAIEQCMLEKQLEHQSMWKAVADISLEMKGWREQVFVKQEKRKCRGTALLLFDTDQFSICYSF